MTDLSPILHLPIRARAGAAPLKRGRQGGRTDFCMQAIRARAGAAPLKRAAGRRARTPAASHPRPRGRGPVEAGRTANIYDMVFVPSPICAGDMLTTLTGGISTRTQPTARPDGISLCATGASALLIAHHAIHRMDLAWVTATESPDANGGFPPSSHLLGDNAPLRNHIRWA